MFTTRSALTACLSIGQHSLMKSRCVLACCCSGLWSSFTHLAGFLQLRETLFEDEKAEKNKIFMIQTVTSLFFLETNLSLTFQGDFCVSMIGRAALRCKKRGVKRCAALHEQLKRRPVPRSGTRNGPWEKEHTSTANTSGERAHGTAKSGIRLSQTHRTCARKRTKTDRVTVPRYPKSKQHRQQGVTDRKPTKNAQNYGLCLERLCTPRGPPARRRSTTPQHPSAAAPRTT